MGMMTAQQGFDKVGLFTETVVKRIIRVADKADYDTTFEGINWYYEAQRLCETLAADSDYTVDQVAVAMAHLSPRLRW